mmetsp:Transcript_6983/g.15924  ORF Transcript_6983/g.15924 Transcript_6983/m.15924 type:complete len:488 (+) Transcript_6983:202-1665(+)|eukprot:CAMPEP_0206468406 /NCGR_PEP_ID=MMETSP0324_2-20121206/29606_1 /ASSEMBLY_ACC=CAM_ASM_000836 /TAXON_ID=2866 /ORGANISM="Crypthecodinium cohnii, Strain Seligo" /LENGTH=487 /DNA_ID=CAMNT_0053941849 /DNA_START=193 /DNA_END=1656 /DNA_ORIENTATION=+
MLNISRVNGAVSAVTLLFSLVFCLTSGIGHANVPVTYPGRLGDSPWTPRGLHHCPTELKGFDWPKTPYLTNWSSYWKEAAVCSSHMRPLAFPGSTVLFTYHAETGATAARVLGSFFARFGYTPLYVEDFEHDELSTVVSGSNAIVLVESDGLMNNTKVLLSIYAAVKNDVPVMPYDIPDFSFSNFSDDCYFLDKRLPQEKQELLESYGVDMANLTWYTGSFLPFIISEDFVPAGMRGNGDSNVNQDPIRSNYGQMLQSGLKIIQPGMAKEAFFYWRDMWSTGRNPRIRPYIPDRRFFVAYVSHHISTSGPDARLLVHMLWAHYGFGSIFLDVNDFRDTRSDPSNVAQSCAFIAVLDKTTWSRTFCLLETFWALQAGRPVTLVALTGKGYNHTAASLFLQNLTAEAPAVLGASGMQMLLQFGEDVAEIERVLGSVIPGLPVFEFDASSTTANFTKQMDQIVANIRSSPAIELPALGDPSDGSTSSTLI